MRIGVFGGSFDPIHNAHLIVAGLAREQLQLDRVHFVVARYQPFKTGGHAAPAEDRLRMVECAVRATPCFVADGRELRRPGPSYTVDTLRDFRRELPAAELVLILGSDVAWGFDKWHEPGAVRELARLAVCLRPGSDDDTSGAAFDYQLAVPALDMSSTGIRARAAAGKSLAGWVPESVAGYIATTQVYRSNAG